MSPESIEKRKLTLKVKGWRRSKEAIQKHRLAMLGRPSKKKGIPLSEDHKKKLSKGRRKSARKIIDQYGQVYDCVADACEKLGFNNGSICHVLYGRTKSIHGYTFRFYNEEE